MGLSIMVGTRDDHVRSWQLIVRRGDVDELALLRSHLGVEDSFLV